jgi:hypothetical protein
MDPQWAAESNLARILSLTGIIHLLALISLGLRLWARIGLLRTPGRDDVAVVAAAVSLLSTFELLSLTVIRSWASADGSVSLRKATMASDDIPKPFQIVTSRHSKRSALSNLSFLRLVLLGC